MLLIFTILPREASFFFLLFAIKAKIQLGIKTRKRMAQIRLFNFEISFSPVKTKDTQGICSKVFFFSYFISFLSFRLVCQILGWITFVKMKKKKKRKNKANAINLHLKVNKDVARTMNVKY